MRPLEEAQQHDEELEEFGTRPLQHSGCKSLHKMAKSKSRQSLKSRTRQVSEPNILPVNRFQEHWRSVTVTYVKEGLVSRYEQKCKKSRDNILKFSLSIQVDCTRSQKQIWNLDIIDSGSSDSGGTETAAGPYGVNPA